MRVLAALAVLLFAVPAMAQSDYPAPMAVAEDGAGDNVVWVAGQGGPQSPRWGAADLRSLEVHENARGLALTLHVASFPSGEDVLLVDSVRYDIRFRIGTQSYIVVMYYQPDAPRADAYLRLDDGSFFGTTVASLAAELGDASFSIPIPHDLIFQPDGSPFLPGTPVTDFSVLADPQGDFAVQGYTMNQVRVEDRMPDSGASDAVWPLVSGVQQEGHIVLSSPTPVRVSNGEATTFVFELDVTNTADFSDMVHITFEGVPAVWSVSAPQAHVRVEPGETRRIPVLATVPFNHEHGTFYQFVTNAQSQADPEARGAIEMGVRYLQVPQPAGHHDTLWLHQESFYRFMNTLEDQPIPPEEDDGSGGSGSCSFSGSSGSGSSYSVELRPSLAMGIDVDMEREGLATFLVSGGELPTDSIQIGGFFVVGGDGSSCLSRVPEGAILEIVKSEPFSLQPNEQREVQTAIRGLPAGDYLPYERGAQMRLIIGIFNEGGALPVIPFSGLLPEPEILPGSSFQLPLNEFHDDVRDIFEAISGVSLRAIDAQQRPVNSGKTVVFRVSLDNVGSQAGDFHLRLTGQNVEWARLLGTEDIRVAGGANRTLAVAVTVPQGTSSGQVADITLHVEDRDDPNIRSLIRLVAKVDSTTDVPDESELAAKLAGELVDQKSPFAWLPALAVVAVAVRLRRKS